MPALSMAPRPTTTRTTTGGPGSGGYVQGSVQADPGSKEALDRQRRHSDSINRGPDANLQTQVDRLAGRLSSDTLDRAVNRTTDSIREQAEAQKAALAGRSASSGFGGAAEQANERIDARAQRAAAGATADLTLANERRLDDLVLGGQGIMGAQGQYGLQRDSLIGGLLQGESGTAGDIDRNRISREQIGLDAWSRGRGLDLEQQRVDQAGEDQALSQWLAMMRMMQGGGAGGYAY